MRKAIDQDTLAALVVTAAARDFRAVRRDTAWMLEARLGGYWLPIRSRREPVRLWLSLTALQRFAESVGIRAMLVEW
uniref:hypothetical protein n=1 Tax=Pseudomonas sp. TaxID=306 RepID=UPI0010B8E8EB|nr:hypothetical protein [Pseudomonas sp.]QBM91765.1 hypothetical protein pA7BH1_p05 [Pseudomonas sp.]